MNTIRCPRCGQSLTLRTADSHDDGRGIESLSLTVRTYNNLHRVGIHTIWELDNLDDQELLSIPNFGKGCLADVKQALGEWRAERRASA